MGVLRELDTAPVPILAANLHLQLQSYDSLSYDFFLLVSSFHI